MSLNKLKKYLTQLADIGFDAVPSSFLKNVRRNTQAAGLRHPAPPVAGSREKYSALEELRIKYQTCKKCPLGASRVKIVFGEGAADAKLMFIGEGPGFSEDHTGRPFIGRAGQLLTRIIEDGMKMKREDVYITNIVKCHPMKDPSNPEKRGNDRPPLPDEVPSCISILREQLNIIRPHVICALGAPAAKILLETAEGITTLRGRIFEVNPLPEVPSYSVKIVPTYHPAYLLRNPEAKIPTWEDIKTVMRILKPPLNLPLCKGEKSEGIPKQRSRRGRT